MSHLLWGPVEPPRPFVPFGVTVTPALIVTATTMPAPDSGQYGYTTTDVTYVMALV